MAKKIAITGYSFRFPNTTTERYWQDLLDGRDLITEVAPERWAKESFLHPDKNHPGSSYSFAAGSIGDISRFDAGFFGISPREANVMDPQQRLLLEMSWEAIENAGIVPSSLRGSDCAVFIGIASSDYSFSMADDLASVDSTSATGNTASIAANRLSYVFDLRGPSMAIDTACSSSMVAFHQACRSILSGESSQAIAGGISLHMHPYGFIAFSKASMLSRKGHCQVFDASGDGYVRSEGGGIFFLKDYDQAVADGNPILAVVANSAVNTDGKKSGLTVPNPLAQAQLLEQTYAQAGIAPEDIDYLEAHGTGTAVGDPLESQALGQALGKRRPEGKPLLIGSVKSNMGHLETASGVAGLVKALNCIQHRQVPATISLKNPNPNIPFDALNLKVVTKTQALKTKGPLTIGVNSFGFGGANAHVILQSPETTKTSRRKVKSDSALPFLLSAKDEKSLRATAAQFADFIEKSPKTAWYQLAYNTAFRREQHDCRSVTFSRDAAQLSETLRRFAADGEDKSDLDYGLALQAPSGPVFVYSGNGSQWEGMGKKLLQEDVVFKQSIQEIDALFQQYADYSLLDELNGNNGANRYEHTEIAQPALFALQVGITEMLRRQGIEPVAVTGHSVGEVAAAWASGALTLAEAVEVIYYRSHWQGTTKGLGGMTAVGLPAEEAKACLNELGLADAIAIAGINSSRGVTIAGDCQALARLEAALNEREVFNRRLGLDYAFHSPSMDTIEAEIKTVLANLAPTACRIPFYSTVSGDLLAGEQLAAEYWWHNIRKPVLFEQAIKNIQTAGHNIFIELGPHPVLRSYLNDCQKDHGIEGRIIPTLMRNDDSADRIASACAQTLIAGAPVDWQQYFPQPAAFLRLPNYPWQRERYWYTPSSEALQLIQRRKEHPLLGYPLKQYDWTWENQIDSLLNPTLADHVVGDAIVFPGSGYAELALAAALRWQNGDFAEIEELEIRSPLILSAEQSKLLRLNIENQDGGLIIRARDLASDNPWTLQCVARILKETLALPLHSETLNLPNRSPDFDGAQHAAMTQTAGLSYGPAFQCLAQGWIERQSVLATLKIPDAIELEMDKNHLHPAILDCTFQLIFQLLKDHAQAHSGIAFVPIKMGRIFFRNSNAVPHSARATLLGHTNHSLTAEFAIFDAAGQAIAVIKETRFRSVRLSRSAKDQLRHLQYYATPKPTAAENIMASGICFDNVQEAVADLSKRAVLKGTHRRYSEEVDPLLDSLCNRFTLEALQSLADDNGYLSEAQIALYCQTNPNIEPYFQHLLKLAEQDQTLIKDGDDWRILPEAEAQPSAQDIWNSLFAEYPDYFQIVHSVGRIGMQLPALLSGKQHFEQIRPQESSLSALNHQVLGSSGKQTIAASLRQLVEQGLQQLPEGHRLSIIEIGAGSAGFAADICSQLDFGRGDYLFASFSEQALDEISRIQERFPLIKTELLTKAEQDSIPTAASQLVVLTLDFDDLQESLAALQFAYRNLQAGGNLLLIAQQPARWLDFVFGAQAEHWLTTQDGNRVSNQRPIGFWQQQLQQCGFSEAEVFEFSPDTLSGPYLLLAGKPETDSAPLPTEQRTPCSWIILAEADSAAEELSDQLTKRLQTRGDMVIQSALLSRDEFSALLQDTTAKYGELDGIIHLAGLFGDASGLTDAAGLDWQVKHCTAASQIIQACEQTQTATHYRLISSAAIGDLLPSTPSRAVANAARLPIESAVWGFGRSLMNEASNYRISLIDLEALSSAEQMAEALEKELLQSDGEQEILLTADGERFVPRLKLVDDQQTERNDREAPIIRLGFQFPGQLRNLRWEAHPHRPLDANEVEIEVRATGLNFRDVMYSLGMLSDEAIENGFAGPSLGMEFAGIVAHVGDTAKSKGFSPGDKVVGFGPFSFANRVMTQADAVAHIPSGVSFEAAATMPSTFLTAYYALHHLAQMQPGEKVLIHGAAGGVGLAAIQLAQWLGAEIYATAGSDEKRDFLRLLGVDHIYDSRSLAFADEILEQTGGQGVDVVLNSLAGEAINRNLRVLKPFGRFLELGKRDFYENTKIGLRPFRNNISYFGIDADQLMLVHPELTRKLFSEIMELAEKGALHPLPYHVFAAEDIVDAFRYMQQARQIGKIIVTYGNGLTAGHDARPQQQTELNLSADASYLVTGGLGGFGLKTAEWLAAHGARHLVLISRSGPASEETQEAIARLQAQGIEVYAQACDITDRMALTTLFETIAAQLPPLRGIVHSATVIEDGLARNMTEEQIRSVLAPKILGAQYLHELSRGMALDLFVLFSSATTLFGNPGQSNYVAANLYLEALASHRRGLGLPATCVCWGAIDDVGFLARNEKIKEALQSRMGGAALNSAVALEALENLILTGQSNVGVMELDWKALSRFLPCADSPKFAELAYLAGDLSDDDQVEDIAQWLAELSDQELQEKLIDILKQEIGEILRIQPDKINPTRSIYEMGLDSLMGVELVVAMENRFGIRIPVMAISQKPTIAKLAEFLLQQLRGHNDAEVDPKQQDNELLNQAQQLAAVHGTAISTQSIADFAEQYTGGDKTSDDRIIH